MKKLIYILLLTVTISSFAQEAPKTKINTIKLSKIGVYPNPFNDKTSIRFYSNEESNISFIVQDLLGNIVESKDIITTKGKNSIPFFRDKLSAGIYVYTLKTKAKIISKRFVIK